MVEIKKILFPIHFKDNSTKILPYVLSVSEKYDGMIYLLHVVAEAKWKTPFGRLWAPAHCLYSLILCILITLISKIF